MGGIVTRHRMINEPLMVRAVALSAGFFLLILHR